MGSSILWNGIEDSPRYEASPSHRKLHMVPACVKPRINARPKYTRQLQVIPCPAEAVPTLVCFEGAGSGMATHLGLTQETLSGSYDQATVTFRGAAGDQLLLKGTGSFCPGSFTETGVVQVTGGTGEFLVLSSVTLV
jgi:hypothetical protein